MSHTASKTYRYYNQMALEIIKDQGVIREILKLIHAHSGAITTANSASVTFTGDGTSGNPLSATATGSLTTANTSTITLSGSGTLSSPLSATLANTAGVGTVYNPVTTNATPTTVAGSIQSTTGASYFRVVFLGKNTSTGDLYSVEKVAAFKTASGTTTQIGTTTSLFTAFSSGAMSGVSTDFTISGNTVSIIVTGLASTTINWRVVVYNVSA